MTRQRRDDEPRDPRDGTSTRYGDGPGSGANEPPRREAKEQREDWHPRQGPNADRGGRDSGDAERHQARRQPR